MAAYLTLSSLTSAPDLVALQTSARAVIADVVVYRLASDPANPALTQWRFKSSGRGEAVGFSPAERASLQSALDTAILLTPQRAARQCVEDWPLDLRACLGVLVDQINQLRTRASLATITLADALTAVRTKIDQV